MSVDADVRAAKLFEIPLLQVSFAERGRFASIDEWLADGGPSSEPSINDRWVATISSPPADQSTSVTNISGGLRLDQLDVGSVCLFVKITDEAARIREVTSWPVVLTRASSDALSAWRE